MCESAARTKFLPDLHHCSWRGRLRMEPWGIPARHYQQFWWYLDLRVPLLSLAHPAVGGAPTFRYNNFRRTLNNNPLRRDD